MVIGSWKEFRGSKLCQLNSVDGFKFLFHGGRLMLVIPVKLLKSLEFKVVDAFHV